MSNWEKAQYIVEKLNEKGAGLGNASWAIVSQALDELDAAQQMFAPDVCPVCAGKRHIQTKSRGLVKCASCNGTGRRR
jgi:hypothetical protein